MKRVCNREDSGDCCFSAIVRKFRSVSFRDKIRLLAKLGVRPFGIQRDLFLGGYFREEDQRQLEQDIQICQELKANESGASCDYCDKVVSAQEQIHDNQGIVRIRKLLQENGTYIAVVVQKLDKGGLEEVIRLLALEMLAERIPFRIFCIQSGGEIAEQLKGAGIEVIVFRDDKKTLEDYCKNHRPLIANTHYVLDYLDVFQKYNIPVIEVIHNMYVFLNQTGKAIEERKVPYVDHYIAVSERAKEVYIHKFPNVSEQKVSVIGNALSGKREITENRRDIREKLGIDEDAFVFIMVGSIDARKNQLGILRAWDIVKHLTDQKSYLMIVGEGTDYEYEKKIKRFLKERTSCKDVIFAGHCHNVPDLLGAADVFVLNSYYEGWSVAATEALLYGLPIIHADCGSGAELTANGKNGILIAHPLSKISEMDSTELYNAMHAGICENVKQLASAMLKVQSDRDYWKAQKNVIIQYTLDHFSSSTVLLKYIKVFLDIYIRKNNNENKGWCMTDE